MPFPGNAVRVTGIEDCGASKQMQLLCIHACTVLCLSCKGLPTDSLKRAMLFECLSSICII